MNQMTEQERNDFLAELEKDDSLRKEVELHKDISGSLASEDLHQFRNVLKEANQHNEQQTKTPTAKVRRLSTMRILAIAASVLFVVMLIRFIPGSSDLSNQELFASYHETYPMLLNQRGVSEDLEADYRAAVVAYQTENFDEAKNLFKKINSATDNNTYIFYEAISNLESSDPNGAILLFKKLIERGDPLFREQSKWFLAMSYLKLDKSEECSKILNEIGQGEFKYKEASELLKALSQ